MSSDDLRPALRPPQFRLRTLMLLVTALCLLAATFASAGPMAAFALLLTLLIVFAHVAGNAIGTQLRENGGPGFRPTPGEPQFRLPRIEFAPASHLSQRYALGLPNIVASIAGAILGGLSGGLLLAWINWELLTPGKLAFGVTAFAAIGGMAGFTAGGFIQVAWKTWRSASREQGADQG